MIKEMSVLGFHGRRGPIAALKEERKEWIQELAYFKALDRGFMPNQEAEDWLAAEKEVDEVLSRFSRY
jgi:hypothetical protein